MFCDYVFDKVSAQYTDKILLLDVENIVERMDYTSAFDRNGFEIVKYIDDLTFRIEHEDKLSDSNKKMVVIVCGNQYVPYDIHHRMSVSIISMEALFPKLYSDMLKVMDEVGLDLLSMVYHTNFDDLRENQKTEMFIKKKVYSKLNIRNYLLDKLSSTTNDAKTLTKYNGWYKIAEKKAKIDVLAAQYDIEIDTREINLLFQQYVLSQFGKLSQIIDKDSPVLVSKAMDYMHEHSDKFIVVVMDGMSEFDWEIISKSFDEIQYEKTSLFAMIPSTTSISRQCLLAGKFPIQLLEPWKQSKERSEFVSYCKNNGYMDAHIGYERGYNAYFSSFVRCGAVIINDVDDIVHAQTQGKLGMFNDMTVLKKQNKLLEMTKRFISNGYDVYITADHGNTYCIGVGKLMGTGVEVETKSRRMIVLKDFADKESLIDKYSLIEYPKYYLSKEYDYLICDVGDSFDSRGTDVMTHGGITIDEIVVPFIKVKAVHKNG